MPIVTILVDVKRYRCCLLTIAAERVDVVVVVATTMVVVVVEWSVVDCVVSNRRVPLIDYLSTFRSLLMIR